MRTAENGRPTPKMQTPISILVASVLALAAAIFLVAVPVFTGTAESGSSDGTVTQGPQSSTLIEQEGRGFLLVLAIPILLTLLPLLASARYERLVMIICTALLGIGVVISMFSIGVFFLPALIAMFVACVRSAPRSSAHAGGPPVLA